MSSVETRHLACDLLHEGDGLKCKRGGKWNCKRPGSEIMSANRAVAATAYTDLDRHQRRRSEGALLAEYARLGLPPVRLGGHLLSPLLVQLLTEHELEEDPA